MVESALQTSRREEVELNHITPNAESTLQTKSAAKRLKPMTTQLPLREHCKNQLLKKVEVSHNATNVECTLQTHTVAKKL